MARYVKFHVAWIFTYRDNFYIWSKILGRSYILRFQHVFPHNFYTNWMRTSNNENCFTEQISQRDVRLGWETLKSTRILIKNPSL